TASFSFEAGASARLAFRAKTVSPLARSTAIAADSAWAIAGVRRARPSSPVALGAVACAATGASSATKPPHAASRLPNDMARLCPKNLGLSGAEDGAGGPYRRPDSGKYWAAMPKKDPLLEEISALLAAEGADDPARLERTLTDGYARALSLEAERRRL